MSKLLATAAAVLTVALCAPAFSTPADARVFCLQQKHWPILELGPLSVVSRVLCTHYRPGGYCRRVALSNSRRNLGDRASAASRMPHRQPGDARLRLGLG